MGPILSGGVVRAHLAGPGVTVSLRERKGGKDCQLVCKNHYNSRVHFPLRGMSEKQLTK